MCSTPAIGKEAINKKIVDDLKKQWEKYLKKFIEMEAHHYLGK